MKKQYRFAELSEEEKEYHEMLLLEEVDVRCSDPEWMKVTLDYRVRGGVHTVVYREHTRTKH